MVITFVYNYILILCELKNKYKDYFLFMQLLQSFSYDACIHLASYRGRRFLYLLLRFRNKKRLKQ